MAAQELVGLLGEHESQEQPTHNAVRIQRIYRSERKRALQFILMVCFTESSLVTFQTSRAGQPETHIYRTAVAAVAVDLLLAKLTAYGFSVRALLLMTA